ncbi:phage tail tape measure protein [Pseudogracilibacillus auburnensis]|uniref:TP901 family phage tail tape measure protein n=1 Tax=Pseudogracilibacillus auburnensis TaxID=1494959 RepID=A0A2V3W552_9BACI|nr:phage tail tape measure protein [Pseudogracilibacillus auburnensis]PXW88826.1 TP901 family phage tail tape measure protein [Pseudogracilibacillus auburnensis]
MANVGDLKTKISLDSAQFQQSMASVNRELRGLKHEQKAVTSSGTGFARGVTELRSKADVLNRTLKVQREQVAELRRRYEESRKATGDNSKETQQANIAYQKAKAEMNKTENALKGITAEIQRQTNPWNKLSKSLDETGRKMQDIGRGMTSFGRSWSMRVTAPILGLGGAAVKVGMDFQEGMSKVQAISGATGEDFEKLKSQARDLGATTRFSATEAASGMEFLAMAGFETNEILDSMPGLLDLAAASGMDLGRSADIASNILSAFKYEASESGRVADVLAAGAASANTNVEQLGGAAKYAAPVFSTLGLEIEGLAASVGFMSDAGIQGEQAGRQLRQGLLRLANPTGEAADLIKDLGIKVFDADGNMKEMHQVVGELEKGLGDMDSKTRAASLAILFGSESTAGWSTLLDRGSKELEKYTKELENSEGAAAKMAEIMEDNARGALREFRSAAEEAGIAFSEHIIPALTDGIKWGTELVRKFGELDDSTQKNIIKMAAFAAAVGPVVLVMGNLVTGVGGLLRVGGKVAGMLGKAGGAGLLGRIGLMGSAAGPVGLATVAIGGLATGFYLLHKESKKNKEISTELAESYRSQADELQALVDEYNELNMKSRLTTEEFGRLMDIQSELNRTQNPALVAELKDEYKELAEKSGMTKEEIERLIEANNGIIEQSPQVEKSYTKQGNALVKSTDAVQKYIDNLNEMAMIELKAERAKALEREAEIMKEQTKLREELAIIDNELKFLTDAQLMSEEQRVSRLQEIEKELQNQKLTHNEISTLEEERVALNQAQLGEVRDMIDGLQKQRDEIVKKIDLNKEDLEKLQLIEAQMADLILSEVDLNFEKGEGLKKLDETIESLKEQRSEILSNMTEEEKRLGLYDDTLEHLNKSISKHEDVRDRIKEEVGYQSEANKKKEQGNDLLGKSNRFLIDGKYNLKNIGKEQDNTNKKIGAGRKEAQKMNKELDKDINKTINLKPSPSIASLDGALTKPLNRTIKLNTAVGGGAGLGYKDGTPPGGHPGGLFMAGEEGYELGRLGNRWEMLNFGMYDRPAGYEVFTHNESKRILRALNNMPGYAQGTNMGAETNRIVNRLNQPKQSNDSQPLVIELHVTSEIDGRVAGQAIERYVTEIQDRNKGVRENFA